MNLDAITDDDIAAAAAMPDLESATQHLAKIAGITEGDIAGMVFSGLDFDWGTATLAARNDSLREWLHVENLYAIDTADKGLTP